MSYLRSLHHPQASCKLFYNDRLSPRKRNVKLYLLCKNVNRNHCAATTAVDCCVFFNKATRGTQTFCSCSGSSLQLFSSPIDLSLWPLSARKVVMQPLSLNRIPELQNLKMLLLSSQPAIQQSSLAPLCAPCKYLRQIVTVAFMDFFILPIFWLGDFHQFLSISFLLCVVSAPTCLPVLPEGWEGVSQRLSGWKTQYSGARLRRTLLIFPSVLSVCCLSLIH